jgi:hypothetical protein
MKMNGRERPVYVLTKITASDKGNAYHLHSKCAEFSLFSKYVSNEESKKQRMVCLHPIV